VSTDHRLKLTQIKRFDQLIAYLRDEMGWPIARDSFDDVDDLFYEFSAEELGIDPKTSAKILEIKRLRPLSPKQPWGIFFVKFEPKKLPVIALRRILGQVALKRRASANSPDRTAWSADDLLFISNYGDGDARQISFAHFSKSESSLDLPTLRVLGWNNLDTGLHLDAVAKELTENLTWPEEGGDLNQWRKSWSDAFKLGHNEVINTAKDLSIRLAELASSIRDRIKVALSIENDSGPLTILKNAFKSSLVNDLDNDSFADMYAQTIAYGLLSARITDPSKKTVDDFTSHMRTSPFLRELMETFLKIGGRKGKAGGPGIDFDELGVGDVIQLLDNVNIEAVLRDFGDKNRQEDPVMHFFEGFLQAYDKKIRKDRGVFYTPQPVVSYIVRSVHELLQTEFGLTDGLADIATWGEMLKKYPEMKLPPLTDEPGERRTISPDEPFVQILDPATGTATFLIEVIDVIHQTLTTKWKQQRFTAVQQLSAWNEYVPKYLLPRLHAFELMMAPYAIAHMKIGLKLAETGYHFATEERARIFLTNALEPYQKQLKLPELDALAHEAASVNEIKRSKRFTVVIGNPPYAGHSANNHISSIVDLIRDYKVGLPELDRPGQGKWLQDDYVKFIRLGEHLLSNVPSGILGYITNHSFLDNPTFKGMRKHLLSTFTKLSITDLHGNSKKKERSIDGSVDENVFEIQQGVAILIGIHGTSERVVKAHDLLGTRLHKYSWLATNLASNLGNDLLPTDPMYLFRAQDNTLLEEYKSGISLPNLLDQNGDPAPGFVTTQDEFAISWTADESAEKVEQLLASKSEADARSIFKLCSQNQWNYARAKAALADGAWRDLIVKVLYRPFDFRWTIYSPHVAVHRRDRVMRHMLGRKNLGIICTRQTKDQWGVLATRNMSAHKTCGAYDINFLFPLYLLPEDGELSLDQNVERLNLAPSAIKRFSISLGLQIDKESNLPAGLAPEDIFHYAYAVLYSPGYRSRYADFLKIDFPSLPLPGNLKLFWALSQIGGELTSLHLLEYTKNDKSLFNFINTLNPEVQKISWSKNTIWLDKSKSIGFQGVNEELWNFHIGGYQVCEKWLKDRKGRILSKVDVADYQNILLTLSETIRLMADIDKVIDKHGGWPGAFSSIEIS
jgi:predicted helicase